MILLQIIISLLILTIAIIESKKTQNIIHNTLMFLGQSKTVKRLYYSAIILLVLVGLLLSLCIAIIKISENNLAMGVTGFMLINIAILMFAFTSYKLAN
ncbi:membrane hypothetical protein [Tenacibaculum maritimum]|uniref:hypothetical protein n=1 Tax=Tenacibaculum maritimum TaxID=107401 RepID=UPI0012E5390E|nr:hypothetical protein [Tenacibaculum maritimum]CAA0155743.1 membrane hypothetical protein [Tenacibaculum maritimum]CAA0233606.1 hypothetical protein JIP32914_470007 [Tenacibaculum maritimum]CAA0235658.1 hypothetical protein TMP248_480003 [Tenacibaculum maritimum]